MKARAVREVHIRSGRPFRDGTNRKGVIYPGFEVEVAGTESGEVVEGNGTWYKDRNGDFYWSGGFIESSENLELPQSRTSEILKFYNVTAAWNAGITGAGINIAVIDTGASNEAFEGHIDVAASEAFRPIPDVSSDGHGTNMTGLISSSDVNGVAYGFAPDSSLTVYNAFEEGMLKQNLVKEALDACAKNPGIHIVNCSYANPDPNIFLGSTAAVVNANKILVAATGNRGPIGFPAAHPNVICVAAIDKSNQKNNQKAVGPTLTLCARGDEIDSLRKNGGTTRLGPGSSQACAIVSGILALALDAYLKKNGHLPSEPLHRWARTILSQSCNRLGDSNTFGFGAISLEKILP